MYTHTKKTPHPKRRKRVKVMRKFEKREGKKKGRGKSRIERKNSAFPIKQTTLSTPPNASYIYHQPVFSGQGLTRSSLPITFC
jgi:hypothetical protein